MTKVRKQKRKKVYKYDMNRKKLNKKLKKTPKILCSQVKEAWNKNKSCKKNMAEMGLAYDPNTSIKIPSKKAPSMEVDPKLNEFEDKKHVAIDLEQDAKAPRERKFRLPNSQVYWLSKLLDTYGEDFKAMARDNKMNHFQETWKQLRAKVKRFKSIPEQWGEYVKKKELESQEES